MSDHLHIHFISNAMYRMSDQIKLLMALGRSFLGTYNLLCMYGCHSWSPFVTVGPPNKHELPICNTVMAIALYQFYIAIN